MKKDFNPREFLNLFDPKLKSRAQTLFLPNPAPPQSNETAVVALQCPRTAALCFDRIWSIRSGAVSCPAEISFNMDTDAELVAAFCTYMSTDVKKILEKYHDVAHTVGDVMSLSDYKDSRLISSFLLMTVAIAGGIESLRSNPTDGMTRMISENLQHCLMRSVTPIYASEFKRDTEYKPGDRHVVLATLRQLEVVDEQCLPWEQVLEFRRDSERRADYRRLVHWLDSQMVGKSNQFIIDEIGVRLDKYRAALRKHGLKTRIGVLSSMIDSKALLSSIAAVAGSVVAGEPLFGSLAAGGVLLGKVLISMDEAKIEMENVQEQHSDIAFVAQVNERLTEN